MPKGVVKTKKDEAKWERAKEITRKQYPEMGETDSFWKIVNSIYQNMTKSQELNMDLLNKSVGLAFLCPERRNDKALAKDLYYLLNNHIENLEKSYKLQDRYKFQCLYISIENKKGSKRHWYDPLKDENGTTLMKYDYGYIRLTEGADGEHVDCYIGPDKNAGRVYVIHQKNPTNGEYDEDKVMLGFNSADEAKTAYMEHYDDPKFFGSIEEYNFLTFKDKVFKKKGKITGDSLQKSKYISKKRGKNGKWIYTYPDEKKEKTIDKTETDLSDSTSYSIWINKIFGKYKKSIPMEDRKTIGFYTSIGIGGYNKIRNYLTTGKGGDEKIKNIIKVMDNYIKNAPNIKEKIPLFRGMVNVESIAKLNKGDNFKEPSFSSFTTSEEYAMNFIEEEKSSSNKILIKTYTGEGHKMAPAIKGVGFYAREKELILERGKSFKILDKIVKDGVIILKVKIENITKLQKSITNEIDYELQKAKYTKEDLKSKNLRWITIRGNHVLVQGMADGSYVVVGGAGGKLTHMKIDTLLSPEEYKARRKEKKETILTELTPEEISEQAKLRKEEIKQKKAAKITYEKKITEILELTPGEIKSALSGKEIDELYTEAKKRAQRKKPKKELSTKDVEAEADELIKRKTQTEIKRAEKAALDVLANEFFQDSEKPQDKTITKEDLKKKIDIDKAMDILKAKKAFRKELKEISKPETIKKKLSFTGTYGSSEEFSDKSVLKDIEKHIETQQNIRLYNILDRQSEAIQKNINSGSAEALNGIIGDVYSGGASISSETIDSLGMEACVQMIANQLYADGKAEQVNEALIKFVEKNNAKIVKNALKEIEERFHNADVIRSLAGKEDDPEAILSVASANGYALRQLTRGQHILGTAVGSLRSAAHLINAIEEGVQDKIFIDVGTNLARARKKASKAGFKRSEYKIKSKSGQKGFVMEIPKESTDKFFDKNRKANIEETKIDRIKAHKENNGYVPEGMKEGIKLDNSQESGLRFFKEKDNILLDFQAGLGKTAIAYASIMEAKNNKGAKKILFVTPAKLRTQTSQESKKFLDSENQKMVMNTDGKNIEQRKSIYQTDGIHFIGHDQLRTDSEYLKAAGYDMIIVDEIHEMTNQRDTGEAAKLDSGRYKGMMQLSDIPLKIGMSGTNIKSSKKELYKKINFIDPNHTLGTMKEFESRYKGLNQGSNAFQDSSNDAFRKELSEYTYTQKKDLAVKNHEEEIRMPMTSNQKKAYKESERKYISEKKSPNKSISKAAAARRDVRNYNIIHDGNGQGATVNNSKINSIINKMETSHMGEKAVIHCYRKKAIQTAVRTLEDKYGKGSVAVIDGDSSKSHVNKTKEAYNDPSSKLKFLIGTKSVEAGLNLQHGGRVTFHLDVPIDAAAKEQRDARQFRRDQENDCHSYMLVTETPYDISKIDQMERKGREMKILGNPLSVESKDESGFLSMLNQVEKEAVSAS